MSRVVLRQLMRRRELVFCFADVVGRLTHGIRCSYSLSARVEITRARPTYAVVSIYVVPVTAFGSTVVLARTWIFSFTGYGAASTPTDAAKSRLMSWQVYIMKDMLEFPFKECQVW